MSNVYKLFYRRCNHIIYWYTLFYKETTLQQRQRLKLCMLSHYMEQTLTRQLRLVLVL